MAEEVHGLTPVNIDFMKPGGASSMRPASWAGLICQGPAAAHLEDVETDGVELAVTEPAVLAQGDADAAGTGTLRDGEGKARVAGVGGKVPAAPCRLASSPAALKLHGLPLTSRQSCWPDSTAGRDKHRGTGSMF
jgi:hypothetical protein